MTQDQLQFVLVQVVRHFKPLHYYLLLFHLEEITISLINYPPDAIKEDIKYPKIEGGVSITFIAGTIKTDFDYSNDPNVIEIELEKFLLAAKTYETLHILTFEFKQSQKRYNNTSGTTTGFPKLIEATVGNDGHSIKTAMDNYILEDDHCGFAHSMSHIGVHTTAILPAVFKAKEVSFIETGHAWKNKIADVTHTQFFYTMADLYDFPDQHNVKTVTYWRRLFNAESC